MNFLSSEYNYSVEQVYLQKWTSKKYSYLKIPRQNNGFLLVLNGDIDYTFDDKKITLSKNDLVFLPAGSNYDVAFHTEKGCVEDLLINFSFENSSNVLLPKTPIHILNDKTNILQNLFLQLHLEFEQSKKSFLVKSLFYKLLDVVHTLSTNQMDNAYSNIKSAKELLIRDYDCSIEQIAEKFFMSRSAFQKKFKIMYGVNPARFRLISKIEKAKTLLITSDIPIKEIAQSLDFYDISYFYKQFFDICKITPKKYRTLYDEKTQV